MPALDRRIIVRRTVTTRNLFGESVETIVDYPLWATRIDLTNEDIEQTGGSLGVTTRDYIVRFDARIATSGASELGVVDGPLTLNVTNVTEGGDRVERRKFIKIQAVGVTP